MTNLAHWRDDIDDALGGEFDGSLSGLCIMSMMSFDLTRGGQGAHVGNSRENTINMSNSHQNSINLLSSAANKSLSYNAVVNHEAHNDNSSNCFKRFKPSISIESNVEEDNRSTCQNKIARQLQNPKNLNQNASNGNENNLTPNFPRNNLVGHADLEANRLASPVSSEVSCNQPSVVSTPDDSSRHSSVDARSSTSQSCLSISTNSRISSRSNSPSDMSLNNCNNNLDTRNDPTNSSQNLSKSAANQGDARATTSHESHSISKYQPRESLLNGGTLKESSYTTSVITTTAPMHFKTLHPFQLKHPFSPNTFHQFSNSSLNHDHFYDRYLSHDSHQPLQTPLIGIERTQDLLSLKLPPHGPEDADSVRFNKDWTFDEAKNDSMRQNSSQANPSGDRPECREDNPRYNQRGEKRRENASNGEAIGLQKGFPFNFRSNNSDTIGGDRGDQHEPIDLNVSFQQSSCCGGEVKNDMFTECMKHFNPTKEDEPNTCYDLRSKSSNHEQNDNRDNDEANATNSPHQFHGQESMFGLDPSKHKFQYVLAAPISAATKLNEDTMTYLNQAQAYEIKLENKTDPSAETRKGFMCSIINMGFHERHMQQAENELWQQWSHQHPKEAIFSVDMKLSYNVFGVGYDGLNKYEFLWDSSKIAGVFIRINTISTEFTPKKHGGEKGVPFKLSIETFSYNSKTHDSYFISAACCQIKVFKPKGAERKIRSDREKIAKRAAIEQEKYHNSSDHTTFRDCSITSLHPTAESSLCYYRHSHGHFASKQIDTSNGGSSAQAHQSPSQHSDEGIQSINNNSKQSQNLDNQNSDPNGTDRTDKDVDSGNNSLQRGYQIGPREAPLADKGIHSDFSASRLMHPDNYGKANSDDADHPNQGYNIQHGANSDSNYTSTSDLVPFSQSGTFNHMYHNPVRSSGSNNINSSQHFNMSCYSHHPLPVSVAPNISTNYNNNNQTSALLTTLAPTNSITNFQTSQPQQYSDIIKYHHSNFRLDKPQEPNLASQNSFYKTSNLSTAVHGNFSNYPINQADSCGENQDAKDGVYQHPNYEQSLNHNIDRPSSHNHSSHFRQRSASTSLTIANGHCSSYSLANQARNFEGYTGHNNTYLGTAIPWSQSAGSSAPVNSPHSIYMQRGANMVQNHEGQTFNIGTNYDCTNNQYNSEHNSPVKNHTSDSSSSCYSQFKANSTLHCVTSQDLNDGIKQKRIGGCITVNSSCADVVSWFVANRFGLFTKMFNNFSGSDLLRLSKTDLIEMCGLIDGIRLFNCLHNQPIKPKRVLYISCRGDDIFHPIYLYDINLRELLRELSNTIGAQLRPNELCLMDDKSQKNIGDKSAMNSSSSTDSRSSIGGLSSETGIDEAYNHGEQFFNDSDMHPIRFHPVRRCMAEQSSPRHRTIGRLLIEGIASAKVIATDQVVQMLDDNSMWELSGTTNTRGILEVCISARRSSQTK